MKNFSLTLTHNFNASPQTVFDALTNPKALAEWSGGLGGTCVEPLEAYLAE